MSRVSKNPVSLPSGVQAQMDGQRVALKGGKGALEFTVHSDVAVTQEDGALKVAPRTESRSAGALAGTTRALLSNMVVGVSDGFEKRLTLVGVGYRAQAKGKILNLNLGFSHPVVFSVPEDVTIETPSQTEVVVKGIDKQRVGQVAANIRGYRPPEPYKGKGVRYTGEHVKLKEAKKK